MTDDTTDSPPRPPRPRKSRCPICGRPQDAAFKPFCSARCKSVDLGRWFGETYSLPTAGRGAEPDEED